VPEFEDGMAETGLLHVPEQSSRLLTGERRSYRLKLRWWLKLC
jgi:hypothetical protein